MRGEAGGVWKKRQDMEKEFMQQEVWEEWARNKLEIYTPMARIIDLQQSGVIAFFDDRFQVKITRCWYCLCVDSGSKDDVFLVQVLDAGLMCKVVDRVMNHGC